MKKLRKTVIYQIGYYGIILLSAGGLGGIALILYLLFQRIVEQVKKPDDLISVVQNIGHDPVYILGAAGIVLLYFLGKALLKARIFFRQYLDFNEDGMSKRYASYDRLSYKQKAEIDRQKLLDNERILDAASIRSHTHPGSRNPEKDMDGLIGLHDIKKKMHEMAARMEYDKKCRKKRTDQDESALHMCFVGPPGTGKTTCARIMTGFLYRYGYIRKNQCIEVDGNFLKAQYAGETSKRVSILLNKAKGGVLFIDEAYALLEKNGRKYGQEALATIVKAMEDDRKDLVIIFAGYENEMKELIHANPGMFSRIKNYLWFGNYSTDELGEIIKRMADNKGYIITVDAMAKIKTRLEKERTHSGFGNARSARNLLEQAVDHHAVNIMDGNISRAMEGYICKEDIAEDGKNQFM